MPHNSLFDPARPGRLSRARLWGWLAGWLGAARKARSLPRSEQQCEEGPATTTRQPATADLPRRLCLLLIGFCLLLCLSHRLPAGRAVALGRLSDVLSHAFSS
jgi:hypothetical protein